MLSVVPRSVSLVALQHPFDERPQRSAHSPGRSIDDVLAEAEVWPRPGAPLSVCVDGEPILADRWGSTVLQPGQLVTARHVPRGIGAIFGIILGALLAVGVPAGGVATGIAVVLTAVVYVGLAVGVSLAVSAIIQAIVGTPEQKNNDLSPGEGSPSLRGTQNRAWLNAPVWRVYGEHRVTFPYGALPYTEVLGGDQYFRGLFSSGFGPNEITDLRLGNTPLAEFDDVEVVVHEGDPGTPIVLTLFPSDVKQDDANLVAQWTFDGGNPSGDFTHVYTQDGDEFHVDFVFPGGLYGITKKNSTVSLGWGFLVEARRMDPTPQAWFNVFQQFGSTTTGRAIGKNGTDRFIFVSQLKERFFQSIRFPAAQGRGIYEVRVVLTPRGRDGSDPNDSGPYGVQRGGSGTLSVTTGDVTIFAFRALKHDTPVRLAGQSLIEVRMRATDQLQGVLQNFNGLVRSKLWIWDKGLQQFTGPSITRNPAWVALDTLRGTANPAPLTDGRLVLDSFADAAEYAQPGVGDYVHSYDRVFDFDTTVGQAADDVLSTMGAILLRVDGKHEVVIDQKRTIPQQHFTPRNVVGYVYARHLVDRPHGIKVKYINPNAFWRQDELTVYDDGYNLQDADTGLTDLEVDADNDKILRQAGDFAADGFVANGFALLEGFTAQGSKKQILIKSVAPTELEVYDQDLVNEAMASGRRLSSKQAVSFETLEMPGVTDTSQIWLHGRRIYALGRHRSEFHAFDTYWEYLVSKRGDFVLFSHFTLGVGSNWGRVERRVLDGAGDVAGLVLDSPCEFETGKTYVLAARLSDNVTNTSQLVNPADAAGAPVETQEVQYATPLDPGVAPDADALCTFGVAGTETLEAVIVSIQPLEELRARVLLQPMAGNEIEAAAVEEAPLILTEVRELQPPESMPPVTPFNLVAQVDREGVNESTVSHLFGGAALRQDRVKVTVQWKSSPGDIDPTLSLHATPVRYELQWRLRYEIANEDPDDGEKVDPWLTVKEGPIIGSFVNSAEFNIEDDLVRSVATWGLDPDGGLGQLVGLLLGFFAKLGIDVRVRTFSATDVASGWGLLEDIPLRDTTIAKPENLTAKVGTTLKGQLGLLPTIEFSWTQPDTVRGWDTFLFVDGELWWSRFQETPAVQLIDPATSDYTLIVQAVGDPTGIGEYAEVTLDYTKPEDRIVGTIGRPRRLKLVNAADPNSTRIDLRLQFLGNHVTLSWEAAAVGELPDLPDIGDDAPPRIRNATGYRVTVVDLTGRNSSTDPLNVLRIVYVGGSQFGLSDETIEWTYTEEMHRADTDDGLLRRSLAFLVQGVEGTDLGLAARIQPFNLAPAVPHLTGLSADLVGVRLGLDISPVFSEVDVAELIVWGKIGSAVSDPDLFDPTLVLYREPLRIGTNTWLAGGKISVTFPPPGEGDLHLRYAVTDSFSSRPDELRVSAEQIIAVTSSGVVDHTSLANDATKNVVEVALQDVSFAPAIDIWVELASTTGFEVVGQQGGAPSLVQIQLAFSGVLETMRGLMATQLASNWDETFFHWGVLNNMVGPNPNLVFEFRVVRYETDSGGTPLQTENPANDDAKTVFPPNGVQYSQSLTAAGFGLGSTESFGVLTNAGYWKWKLQAKWRLRFHTPGLARFVDGRVESQVGFPPYAAYFVPYTHTLEFDTLAGWEWFVPFVHLVQPLGIGITSPFMVTAVVPPSSDWAQGGKIFVAEAEGATASPDTYTGPFPSAWFDYDVLIDAFRTDGDFFGTGTKIFASLYNAPGTAMNVEALLDIINLRVIELRR